MQREEKQLDNALEAIIQRVQDIKNSISAFIFKIETEYESLEWPTVLDNFALLSGQVNSLNKLLKNDRIPQLKNYVLLPLTLSPDRDQDLEKLTENRVLAFNHEVVPDYLRTKPEIDVEEKINQFNTKAAQLSVDVVQKQINTINKISTQLVDHMNSSKEEWENEANQKRSQQDTSSQADTHTLIAVISSGRGLKQQLRRQDAVTAEAQRVPQPARQAAIPTPQINMPGKPGSIRTNIKSHPYARP